MKSILAKLGVKQTIAAVAVVAACTSASAATFTVNPSSLMAGAASFSAENVIVADFATTTFSGTSFTETGFLSIQNFQLGGSIVSTPGLNTGGYGMYIAFTGTGSALTGTFSSLTYTLFGYSGAQATFTPTSTTAVGAVALGTGSLISGGIGNVAGAPAAAATLSFARTAAGNSVFTSPTPFYNAVSASFTASTSVVTGAFPNPIVINGGGGNFSFFATPVPEPETYALMLAGLGVVGFVARRRKA